MNGTILLEVRVATWSPDGLLTPRLTRFDLISTVLNEDVLVVDEDGDAVDDVAVM